MGWQDDIVMMPTVGGVANARPAWMNDILDLPKDYKNPALTAHFGQPREAQSFADYLTAGFQGSATGHIVRNKLPDVAVSENTPWYGRAAAGFAGFGADLPEMMIGGLLGGGAGSLVSPVAGTAVGAGAGAMAIPAAIRQAYVQALSKGQITGIGDFADRVGVVAWDTFKEGVVGGVFGAAGLAARVAMLTRAGIPAVTAEKIANGTVDRVARKVGGTAAMEQLGVTAEQMAIASSVLRAPVTTATDISAQVLAGTTAQSLIMQGRMPEAQDFLDGAILFGGMHFAIKGAQRLRTIYGTTGKTPVDVLEDAKTTPSILLDLSEATKAVRDNERGILEKVSERENLIRAAEDKAFRGETPTPEESAAAKEGRIVTRGGSPEFTRALDIQRIPEAERTTEETYFLDAMMRGEYGYSAKQGDIRALINAETVKAETEKRIEVLTTKAADTRAEAKTLTPEQQTQMDAARQRHENTVAMYKRNFSNSPTELGAALKGEGMRFAAEKRRITGELTAKEAAKEKARLESNYRGKEVIVDGKRGTVERVSFGKVQVKLEDGTVVRVEKEKAKPADEAIPAAAETKPTEGLTPEETAEHDFLVANKDNPQAIADRYNLGITEITPVGEIPLYVRNSESYQKMRASLEAVQTKLPSLPKHWADAAARTYWAQYDAMARRYGMSVDDLYRASPLEFATGQPQGDAMAAQGTRGYYQRAREGSPNVIGFLDSANASTSIHEGWHFFFDLLVDMSRRPDAPAEVRADVAKMFDYLGIKDIPEWDALAAAARDTPEHTRWIAAHEQMARTGEAYVLTGEFPTAGVRSVFSRFKEWMAQVYKSITELGVKVTPEIREVFDRIIGADVRDDIPRAYKPIEVIERGREMLPDKGREPGFKAEQVALQPTPDDILSPAERTLIGRINPRTIDGPEALHAFQARIEEVYRKEILDKTGGEVKTWKQANMAQMRIFANLVNANRRDVEAWEKRIPENSLDETFRSKKLAMIVFGEDSMALRDKILTAYETGEPTWQMQLDYLRSIERAAMAQAEFLGMRAAFARGLNQLKDVSTGYGEDFLRTVLRQDNMEIMKAQVEQILRDYEMKYGRAVTVKDIADLHRSSKTAKEAVAFADGITSATNWQKFMEAWKAGLLSGPVTPVTNIVSTAAFMYMRPIVDQVASVIGLLRGASPEQRVQMSSGLSQVYAMTTSWFDAAKVGFEALKHERTQNEKLEFYKPAIGGRTGEIVRIPYRLMEAGDQMLITMYKSGQFADLAFRQAIREGLVPNSHEFATRVSELKENPIAPMLAEATQMAERMSFRGELGTIGKTMQLFIHRTPALHFMVPFVRTPINIAKEFVRLSPFAPLIREWRNDIFEHKDGKIIPKSGVATDRAYAEWALGTAMFGAVMSLAFSGMISGNGEPEAGKKEAKRGVWQSYSIKIGDTWYEYRRIEPFGTLLGAAADAAEAWKHFTSDEADKVPKMLAIGFANAITSKTFLSGITGVINAISDPSRYGEKYAEQVAGSMVPNIMGQTASMADPWAREVNSIVDAVRNRVWGGHEGMLIKKDWLGENVPSPDRLAGVSPIRMQKIDTDAVRQWADKLNISVAKPPKKLQIVGGIAGKIGQLELTPEERNAYAEASGKFAYPILSQIVSTPQFQSVPDLIKKRMFETVITRSHAVGAMILPPEKRQAVMQDMQMKLQTQLQGLGASALGIQQ